MADNCWVGVMQFGTAASRPLAAAMPSYHAAAYYATDTGKWSFFNGTAWVESPTFASVVLYPVTYANRPTSPTTGQLAYFTDLGSHTIGDTAAGGGTDKAICAYDGTNWIVGGVPAQA